MKTVKFVLVICGVLHCIMSAITLTGIPQYEIAVTIDGYTNPQQTRCSNDMNICRHRHNECCDGFNSDTFECNRCDSFFTYCLRNVDTLTSGCPEGGSTMRSDVSPNDTSIDFSQNTVLGLDNLLVFQGKNHTWNGAQLYVEIRDQDQDGSQLIDIVRWNINVTQSAGVPSGTMNLTGLYGIVTIKMNITVLCLPGFTGSMCEEDIDDCVGVSCSGNAQCVDGVNSFTCNCTFGFIGVLCNETNKCFNVTCSGRGRCVTEVASYVCDCDVGFTGENCEINIDDCLSNPCGKGGQCVDGVDSFICVCNPGFKTGIDNCIGVDCGGNGECVDHEGSFICYCKSGYSGSLCTEVIQSISVIPIVCGAVGALILILTLTLLVIITLKCVFSSKHFSQGVSKCYDSQTQNEQFEMKENEVYGVSITAPEPKKQLQVLESVSMSTNVCYATVTIQKQL